MAKMVLDSPPPTQQIRWSLRQSDNGVHLVGHDGKSTKTVIEIHGDGNAYLIGNAELDGLETDEEGCVLVIKDV